MIGDAFQPMRAANIDRVRIAVPNQLDSRKRVIPAKVHAANAGPVRRKLAMIASNRILRDRKDSARTENRNTLRARFQFMRRVTRNDLLLLVFGGSVRRHRWSSR
jgi:hypothetical protein